MQQPRRDHWAGHVAPPVMGLGLEAIQGMTNAMNAIANQVIRNSGRFGRNAGYLYFDGTFRDYPAFKRKFESFQMTYHRGTPSRELFQQFSEMCLPEKLSAKIKSANTMETAWIRLKAWFGDKALFIKDLMQDIKGVAPIKEGDDERKMDYYVTLQAHIEEARSAGALDMLLNPANVELMVLPLTTWEKRIWREAQGRLPAEDRSWYMDVFVNERLRYAINMVATSERHVLPKATPYHRSHRSLSLEGQGGRYSRPGSFGRNAKVMAVTESRSADRKKVHFPPPKAWDPEAKWTQDCVMFKECGEKHAPGKCDAFRKLSLKQRLKVIEDRELCLLRAFLAESTERAYNTRVGGQWGSGLSDPATAHLIDAVGYHLVPMYRLIGPAATIALLVLFLVGIVRMLLDIVVRAVAIAKVRGCRWWLMGAFWGTLFQVAVAPVQWAMAKGHNIGKTVSYQMTAEAARLEIEDNKAQRLTAGEMDGALAPRVQINNLDRLVTWSNEFLGRRDSERVYPVPITRCEQATRASSTTVDMNVDEEKNKGCQPRP
jgi:hypothetical protein